MIQFKSIIFLRARSAAKRPTRETAEHIQITKDNKEDTRETIANLTKYSEIINYKIFKVITKNISS
jgi:hypothetical protein